MSGFLTRALCLAVDCGDNSVCPCGRCCYCTCEVPAATAPAPADTVTSSCSARKLTAKIAELNTLCCTATTCSGGADQRAPTECGAACAIELSELKAGACAREIDGIMDSDAGAELAATVATLWQSCLSLGGAAIAAAGEASCLGGASIAGGGHRRALEEGGLTTPAEVATAALIEAARCCTPENPARIERTLGGSGAAGAAAEGQDAGSCDDICAEIGRVCSEAELDALTCEGDAAVLERYTKAGFSCSGGLQTHCDDTDTNQCTAWGSPYIHNDHVDRGLCWGGRPAAPCGQVPVDRNHRRLCPCTQPHLG